MLADEPVTSGRVTFSVRDIKHLRTSQYSLIVGVFDNADVDDFNNGSLSMDTHAWSYDHKKMIVKTPTGEQKVSAGGVLSITLDLNRGLIIFSTGQNDAVQFSTTLPIGQGKEYRAFIRARYLHASLAFNKLQL
jgi:hypothetical protein